MATDVELALASRGGFASFCKVYLTVEQFNPVPGPLPILGVAAAFRWTRRLRKRQRDSQSSYKL